MSNDRILDNVEFKVPCPDLPNVRGIVKFYLGFKYYQGLYNDANGCSCEYDNLMPCQVEAIINTSEIDRVDTCKPGVKVYFIDGPCTCGKGCNWHIIRKPSSVSIKGTVSV